MSNKWMLPAAIVALVLLSLPLFTNRTNEPNHQSKPFFSEQPSELINNHAETEGKLQILSNDVKQSSELVNKEALSDLTKLTDITSSKEASKLIAQLQEEHPHYAYIRWEKNKSKVQGGNLPVTKTEEAKSYINQANRSVLNEEQYVSPVFEADEHIQYQAVSLIRNDVKAVAYIKQSIMPLVEMHQKNNLKLVPFAQLTNNNNIDTVHPNTTNKMHVLTGEDNENASHYYENEVVVKFNQEISKQQLEQIKTVIDAKEINHFNNVYIFKSKSIDTKSLITYFKKNWQISFIEPHYIYVTNTMSDYKPLNPDTIPNDTLFSSYQWNLSNISAEQGWNYSQGSQDVTIAILDTGVQFNHPDLSNKVLQGKNITNTNTTANDDVGHGTHVTGIIGAIANNNEGIAGLSWYNSLLPVKVLNSSGYGSTYAVAQGIIWATDNGAKVINMSLGNYASADFLHEAIKYAYERDVVLIAATGNDNTSRPGYPAAYPEVLAVGATTYKRDKASFSNYGDYVDVVAPGDSIASTYIGGQYAALSGTSMATPHVAALAGLIRSNNPSLTNVEVMDILRQTATDIGQPGKDSYFGYGEINAEKALAAAASYNGTLQDYASDTKKKLIKAAR